MFQSLREWKTHHDFERTGDKDYRRTVGLANIMKPAQPKKSVPKQPDRNVRRQRATAYNLAKGMSQEKAMLQAGYSPSYAHDHGYQAVKRPCIQSAFTDSCERIMKKREMQFDEIVEPYFDGLKAPLIVKSAQLGDAYMPLEPKTQQPYPDHALRMDAADRIVDLYGGKPSKVDTPVDPPKPFTIIFHKETKTQIAVAVQPTGRTSIMPEGETKHPPLPVRFVKPNGST